MENEKDISKEKKTDKPETACKLSRWMAVSAIVVTVAAWCVFFYDGTTAMAMAVLGAVASALGMRCGRGCLRDVAITALIGAVVLIVVYGVFTWLLPYFIGKI